MNKRARFLAAVCVLAVPTLVACVADTGGPLAPGDDAGFDFPDTGVAIPPGCISSTGLACLDATVPPADAGIDATIPDAAQPDSSQPDANQPDTSEIDASEASIDTGTDAHDAGPDVFDAGTDAFDSGPDAFDSGPDVFDAGPDVVDAGPDVVDTGIDVDAGPPQCATEVFSNYYLRASGTIVFYNGTSTEVLIDTTSAPLTGVTQVFSFQYAACARRNDATVWCWPTFDNGNNTNGQLGNGTFTEVTDSSKFFRATQVEISHPDGGAPVYLDQVTSLPTGSSIGAPGSAEPGICAIRSDQTLWCWGSATQGHLWQGTIGTSADLAFATQIADTEAGAPLSGVLQVSAGGRHMCFLKSDGVYCWGNNTSGELGTGETTDHPYPFKITANLPATIDLVGAGADQTCVLAGGNVYCWGADTYNSEGDPFVDAGICNSNYCKPLPVPVLAALADGGLTHTPLANATALAMGDDFACVVDTSQNIHCWGAATGTPQLIAEAIPFVNPQAGSGVPSGPVTSLSAYGDGFNTQLRYITTSGVYVYGNQIAAQVCP